MQTLLLAEDDLQLVRLYQIAFESAHLQFLVALNGEEAIEQAKKHKPDLILLDLVMPKKDGFTTLQELKADSDLKTIPVFCLSVLHQQSDIDRCLSLGAEKYVNKSNTPPQSLVSIVVERLGSAKP